MLIQNEQNPLVGLLLADLFGDLANPLFFFVFLELHETLTVERVEPDSRVLGLD